MEEDIKRTERLYDRCTSCQLTECINCEISYGDVQSVENIVKGYKELEKNLKISDKYLKLLYSILIDYDGYYDKETKKGSVEGLAGLVDQTLDYIQKALDRDDKSVIYIDGDNEKYNIFLDKIKED